MRKHLVGICLVFILFTSCTSQYSSDPTGLAAWIDAPLNGSTIPLAPYEIVTHSSDPIQIKQLEISVNGEILGLFENPNPGGLLFSARLDWRPAAPGIYTIQARGQNSSGAWSSPAQVQVTVEETIQYLPTLELAATETQEVELIDCEPEVTALTNTTCRQGPTTFNEPVLYLIEGEIAPLLGGNQDFSWWAVLPPSQIDSCWVSGQTVEAHCLPEAPEIIDSPPYITRVFPSHEEFYWGDHHLRSVTIQAQSGGETPVTGVRLIYHLAGKADWYNTAMVQTEQEIWQAQINAHTFKGYQNVSSAKVEYYLEAVNDAGLITQSPIYNNLKLKEVP